LSKLLTTLQAVIIVVIILVAVIAAALILTMQRGAGPTTPTTPTTPTSPTSPATSPSPTTTPATPTPSPITTPTSTPSPTPTQYVITIGDVTIAVSREFYEFVEKARKREVSVKIYFGHALGEAERPAFHEIISMFEQAYPGIDVEEIPYAQMDVLKAQISAIATLSPEMRQQYIGKVPDVFTWAHDWIGSFAENGYIIPLEEVLSDEAIVNDIAPNMLPIAMAAVTYKLKTYGLPYAGEAIALIINKKLVPTPPKTFDEMRAIMQQFHDPARERYGLSYQFDPYHLYPFITAFGGYYYDEAKGGIAGIGVNSTGTKQGVEFYVRNILPYLDTSDLGYVYQTNLFLSGKTPMIITGPWNIPAISKSIGLENIIITPIPNIGDKVPKPFVGFRNMYITIMAKVGGSERLYASVLFVLYLCLNDEALKVLVDKNGYVPVKLSMINYVEEHKDQYPIVYGFLQQVLRGVPMPKDPLMDKVWGVGTYLNAIVGEYTNAIAMGKSVNEAVEAAVAVISQKLDEAYESIVSSITSS